VNAYCRSFQDICPVGKLEDERRRHHLPRWIRSFDLFRHRRVAIVSWGVHGLFFLEVCSWGRVSGVWCCQFFQGGWSSFVCIWVSRLVFQRSLVFSLWLRLLFSSDCLHYVVRGGGVLAGLNDLTGYAGGNFLFLVGPPLQSGQVVRERPD